MAPRKRPKTISSFVEDINSAFVEMDIKTGEFTEWLDKASFRKNYNEFFQELLEDSSYELIDLGPTQAGAFKKILQCSSNPAFRIVIYHDHQNIINTALADGHPFV
jgi:hypothetical protein